MKFSVQLQSLPDISASLEHMRGALYSSILLASEVRDSLGRMELGGDIGRSLSQALDEMDGERNGCIQLQRAIGRIGEAYASCEAAAVDICEGAVIRDRQRTPETGNLSPAAGILESPVNQTEMGGR